MSKHTEKSFMTRLKAALILRTFPPILQCNFCLFLFPRVRIILAPGTKGNCRTQMNAAGACCRQLGNIPSCL